MSETNPFSTANPKLPGPIWLQFLVLGALLHGMYALIFPAPLPVLGPPSTARIALLADNYAQLSRQPASPDQLERFIDIELRDELLFREAIKRNLHRIDGAIAQRIIRNMVFLDPKSALSDEEKIARGFELNMHLTDEVVRRRLVQIMEQLLVAAAAVPSASEAELKAIFEARRDEFVDPLRVSFSHVFFGERPQLEVSQAVTRIKAENLQGAVARALGTAFLAGFDFNAVTLQRVTATFGEAFASGLATQIQDGAKEGDWLVVQSVYGQHAVQITALSPSHPLVFDTVREQLAWEEQKRREQDALDAAIERLMAGYEVRRS